MSDDEIYRDNDSIPEEGNRIRGEKQPSEFATFIRDTFIRALDHYATRVVEPRDEDDKKPAKPVRKIADHWLTMQEEQKVRFFDQVVGAAEVAIAAAPVALATLRERKKAKAAEAEEEREPPAPKKKAAAKKPAKKKTASKASAGGTDKNKSKPKTDKKKK